jgi:hypothetical protein
MISQLLIDLTSSNLSFSLIFPIRSWRNECITKPLVDCESCCGADPIFDCPCSVELDNHAVWICMASRILLPNQYIPYKDFQADMSQSGCKGWGARWTNSFSDICRFWSDIFVCCRACTYGSHCRSDRYNLFHCRATHASMASSICIQAEI